MRINISISKKDLATIDDYCDRNGYTRSKFLILNTLRRVDQEKEVLEITGPKFAPQAPRVIDTPAPKIINTPKQAKAAVKEPQDKIFFNPQPKPVKKRR